jgi:hypothetical protein
MWPVDPEPLEDKELALRRPSSAGVASDSICVYVVHRDGLVPNTRTRLCIHYHDHVLYFVCLVVYANIATC